MLKSRDVMGLTSSRMAQHVTFPRTVVKPSPKCDQTSCDIVNTGVNVFSAGLMGIDPATGQLVPGGVEAETTQTMKNLKSALEKAQSGFANVMKTNIILSDINDAEKVNNIYKQYFNTSHGSSIIQAKLPKGARVQVELIGLLDAFKLTDQTLN